MTFNEYLSSHIKTEGCRNIHRLNLKKFSRINEKTVSAFILEKKEKNSPASANSYTKTIKLWRKWKIEVRSNKGENKDVFTPEYNWIENLKIYAEEPVAPVVLSNKQIALLCGQKTIPQMDMFWRIFAYHPFRGSEILRMTKDCVNFQNKSLSTVTSKTFNRTMKVADVVWPLLEAYVENLRTHLLFPSPKDQSVPVSQRYALKDFNRRLVLCGIQKRRGLYPNSFRHTTITDMLNSGSNLVHTSYMAGHKNPETTKRYWRPDLEVNKREMDKRSLIYSTASPIEKVLTYEIAITNDLIFDPKFKPDVVKQAMSLLYQAII